jgi:hypothetical protein
MHAEGGMLTAANIIIEKTEVEKTLHENPIATAH